MGLRKGVLIVVSKSRDSGYVWQVLPFSRLQTTTPNKLLRIMIHYEVFITYKECGTLKTHRLLMFCLMNVNLCICKFLYHGGSLDRVAKKNYDIKKIVISIP